MARKKAPKSSDGPVRDVTAGSHNRSFSGYIPVAKGGGLTAFESFLEENHIRRMARDNDISKFRAQPETFAWRDEADGRHRRYTPDCLAQRSDGTLVYREVKPFKILSANPDLSGRRARIELECRNRGADFEIWTEFEIRGVPGAARILRPSKAEERLAFACLDEARLGGKRNVAASRETNPILRAVSDLLKIRHFYPHALGWVGKSALTNVVMSVYCDLRLDPDTRQIHWTDPVRGFTATRHLEG